MSRSLEKSEEREFVKKMKSGHNIRAIKFEDKGRKGAPDRMVMLPSKPLFIEFKREGEELRVEQVEYHIWMLSLGYDVITCWSALEAIAACVERMDFKDEVYF